MKLFRRFFVVVLLVTLGASVNGSIVEISVATDKPVYQLGESVIVSITAYNPSLQPITLIFSGTQATYLMDGTFDWTYGKPSISWDTERIINPHESYTWNRLHGYEEMTFYPLGIGSHSVVGTVSGYGSSSPIHFEVVPEPAAASFILISLPLLRNRLRRRGKDKNQSFQAFANAAKERS